MRSTVIPAQITTVEDKITGNLNLTQILLFLAPVLWSTLIYAVMFPQMRFTWIKVIVMGLTSLLSLVLAMRVRGKVMIEWLIIIARYNARPAYWIFNKNEATGRTIDYQVIDPMLPTLEVATTKEVSLQTNQSPFTLKDLIRANYIFSSQKINLRYRTNKKGGLHVAFDQIAK